MFLLIAGLTLPANMVGAEPPRTAWFATHRAEARRALDQLEDGQGRLQVHWPAHRVFPAMVRGLSASTRGATPAQRARHFLGQHPALFIAGAGLLKVVDTRATHALRVVRFAQFFKGVLVEHAGISVALDRAGKVRAVHSNIEPVELRSTKPRVKQAAALQKIARTIKGKAMPARVLARARARLLIQGGGSPRLVYKISLPLEVDPVVGCWHLLDAHSGEYLGARKGIIVEGRTRTGEVRP